MTQSLTDRNTHAREAARAKKARDRQKEDSLRFTGAKRPYSPHKRDVAWIRDWKVLMLLVVCKPWISLLNKDSKMRKLDYGRNSERRMLQNPYRLERQARQQALSGLPINADIKIKQRLTKTVD